MRKRVIGFILVFCMAMGMMMPGQVFAAAQSGTCGSGVTWSFSNGTLTIGGSGAMTEFATVRETPWYSFRNSIKSVVVGDGVTSIGAYSFWYCEYLSSVKLGNGITDIGFGAFHSTASLSQI